MVVAVADAPAGEYVMVMVMVICNILGPSPVLPIYLAGSFGLVRPARGYYTRSAG